MPTGPNLKPPVTAAPKKTSTLKKLGAAFLAAITTPTAIKEERSLAALIVFRLLLAVGASTGLVDLIVKAVHG